MDQAIVTTNLRIPRFNWLQVKALAGEAEMSLNEYINYIINLASKARQLSVGFKKIPLKPLKRDSVWEWPDLAKKLKAHPMGLSPDDELIYG